MDALREPHGRARPWIFGAPLYTVDPRAGRVDRAEAQRDEALAGPTPEHRARSPFAHELERDDAGVIGDDRAPPAAAVTVASVRRPSCVVASWSRRHDCGRSQRK